MLTFIAIILAVIGVFFVVGNVGSLVQCYLDGKPKSMFHLVGGLFLAVACLIQPFVALKYYFWVAFIIDFTWLLALWCLFIYLFFPKLWKKMANPLPVQEESAEEKLQRYNGNIRILRELAGVWVVELPYDKLELGKKFRNGMDDGWQKTNLLLREDGTCEIHGQKSGKTLMGTWESYPQFFNAYTSRPINTLTNGGTEEAYTAIRVWANVDDHVAIELHTDQTRQADCCFCVWKIKGREKESYRLQLRWT